MVLRFPFVPCPFRVHNCVKCIIAFLSYICMSMTLKKTIIIIIILEVEYILIFYKNCIFSTLLKVSGKPTDSGNICFIGFVFSMEDISTKKIATLNLDLAITWYHKKQRTLLFNRKYGNALNESLINKIQGQSSVSCAVLTEIVKN